MVKTYILTFHRPSNHGAVLQAYALSTYLSGSGSDVQIVDYDPATLRYTYHSTLDLSGSLVELPKKTMLFILHRIRKYRFNQFITQYLRLTQHCGTCEEVIALPPADNFVVGSDQVWNLQISGGDKTFFLPFTFKGKKVAYSASSGSEQILEPYWLEILPFLKDFGGISVREDTLCQVMRKNGIANCQHTLDPVFLLEAEDYRKIAIPSKYRHPYILIYEMDFDARLAEIAKHLAKRYGLHIVQINRVNNRYGVDKLYPCSGPREFLGLIDGAEFIVSNSFHGIAFSIVYRKQFFASYPLSYKSRIASLLTRLHLTDRAIDSAETVNRMSDINYQSHIPVLTSAISESKQFLQSYLFNRNA